MKLQFFKFLTDENIDIEALREGGCDVLDIKESSLWGMDDFDILQKAYSEKRVVITQDSDFGTLIFRDHAEVFGVMYLRPGHASPDVHVETTKAIFQSDLNFEAPFILVAENNNGVVKIRLRQV